MAHLTTRQIKQLIEIDNAEASTGIRAEVQTLIRQLTAGGVGKSLPQHKCASLLPTVGVAQSFWQGVWDELEIKAEVPPLPTLTQKQTEALTKYGFMLVYIPEIPEDDSSSWTERFPFQGFKWSVAFTPQGRTPPRSGWVAIESIEKPGDDSEVYPHDILMASVMRRKRFSNSFEVVMELLAKISRNIGFPKPRVKLPSSEELNMIGNMFEWLVEHRLMELPNLGKGSCDEWCGDHIHESTVVGLPGSFREQDSGASPEFVGFRVLIEL